MQCFYCLRLGHIKANCYKRKIDLIFEWLVQMAKDIKEIQKRRFKTQKNVLDKIKEIIVCIFTRGESEKDAKQSKTDDNVIEPDYIVINKDRKGK